MLTTPINKNCQKGTSLMENQNKGRCCKHCGAQLPKNAAVCPECGKKTRGIIRRFWWAWIVIAVMAFSAFGSAQTEALEEQGAPDQMTEQTA